VQPKTNKKKKKCIRFVVHDGSVGGELTRRWPLVLERRTCLRKNPHREKLFCDTDKTKKKKIFTGRPEKGNS